MRLHRFEVGVILACLLALLVLGPLRGLLDVAPAVPFAGAMVLLAAPGALLTRWFARDLFPGVALVPAAVALGLGLYGVLGTTMLLTRQTLNTYLWSSAAVLAVFLVAAAVRAFLPAGKGKGEGGGTDGNAENNGETEDGSSAGSRLLWMPFVALGGVLVYLAGKDVPLVDGDTWNALAWVREYLSPGRLAMNEPYFENPVPEVSRILINGYLLEQAALSRLTGIDPVTLVVHMLSPTLIAVALLAVFALGRFLFGGQGPALVAGCGYALFMLIHTGDSVEIFGGEFLGRTIQDKGVARFVFFPVAMCFAAAFLQYRRFTHLGIFAFLCWASVTMHPAGLAIIGLSAAGFGLVYVLTNLRSLSAWTRATALGAGLLSILLVPAAYLLVTGRAISSTLYSADISGSLPVVLANQVFVREEWRNIYLLENGQYIMHPELILNPIILTGYLLGVPFLLWKILRGDSRGRLAAQLLFGTLLVTTVVSYVPPIATFLGDNVVAPGQLHRLSWPVPLFALLTLGWMFWEGLRRVAGRSGRPAGTGLLALALVLALSAGALPWAVPGVNAMLGFSAVQAGGPGGPLAPEYRWLQDEIEEPTVIMAPDGENTVIPAYSADANVISFRGAPVLKNLEDLERVSEQEIEVPQGSQDVWDFYAGPTRPERRAEILRRYDAEYVMISADNGLVERLAEMPALTPLETPGERYVIFAVDRAALSE